MESLERQNLEDRVITSAPHVIQELQTKFGQGIFTPQDTRDGIPTVWVSRDHLREMLRYLKEEAAQPFRMLYDLTAIDERTRQPARTAAQ